jgi:hypothetical protein
VKSRKRKLWKRLRKSSAISNQFSVKSSKAKTLWQFLPRLSN